MTRDYFKDPPYSVWMNVLTSWCDACALETSGWCGGCEHCLTSRQHVCYGGPSSGLHDKPDCPDWGGSGYSLNWDGTDNVDGSSAVYECPTHGRECPGHFHVEIPAEGPGVARIKDRVYMWDTEGTPAKLHQKVTVPSEYADLERALGVTLVPWQADIARQLIGYAAYTKIVNDIRAVTPPADWDDVLAEVKRLHTETPLTRIDAATLVRERMTITGQPYSIINDTGANYAAYEMQALHAYQKGKK